MARGFRAVPVGAAHGALTAEVSFATKEAFFPRELVKALPGRVTWEVDDAGGLRARFAEGGGLLVRARGPARTPAVSTVALYRFLGRALRGRYPITVDGTDIYIELPPTTEATNERG